MLPGSFIMFDPVGGGAGLQSASLIQISHFPNLGVGKQLLKLLDTGVGQSPLSEAGFLNGRHWWVRRDGLYVGTRFDLDAHGLPQERGSRFGDARILQR